MHFVCPILPVWDVLGSVASLGQVVENETGGATVAARFKTVDADVKVLAVSGVSVQWVGDQRCGRFGVLDVGRAVELDNIYVCNHL